LARRLLGQKLNAEPTSLGIPSQGEIFAVVVLDAIGGQADKPKMRQNRTIDPLPTCGFENCCFAKVFKTRFASAARSVGEEQSSSHPRPKKRA
jgi:hypothetical protein